VIIYCTFKINQKEIAKTLCILRAQKNNTCKGNCVLKSELKKDAENEKKHATLLKEKLEIIYTLSALEHSFSTHLYTQYDKIINSHYSGKPISIAFPFFHPPTV
jgi:hypothetical protein